MPAIVPQHDVDKTSKAFRTVWKFLREVGHWSEVIVLASGALIALAKGLQVAAREVKALVAGDEPPADETPKPEPKPAPQPEKETT